VSRIEDLDALAATGAGAVVIGKAFYEGAFTVEQALARAARNTAAQAESASR
jgi:phosphoribosylformimino-5-aminoimidazole carboxamide ribonucleotide (ProFAR) isomerase